MKRFLTRFLQKYLIAAIFFFAPYASFTKDYSIVQWNVQTFFDSTTEGIEYSDFQKNPKWNTKSYEKRLDKLAKGITKLNADIYILEEIENPRIIMDISNRLAGHSWDDGQNWNYATFAKNPGDSIGCAVLSKYPLSEITIHNLDARPQGLQAPPMRPIMKLTIGIGRQGITLFVNHWKSKAGGAEQSEIWRNLQENNLARLVKADLQAKNRPVICAGDFNRDISEFHILSMDSSTQNVALRLQNNSMVPLTSPWISKGNFLEPGSYYFNSNWTRIDHIFYCGAINQIRFASLQDELWCKEDGSPFPYKVYNNNGFSDHLPIRLIFGLD